MIHSSVSSLQTGIAPPDALVAQRRFRRLRQARRRGLLSVTWLIAGLVLGGIALTLTVGQSVTAPLDVLRVLWGAEVPGETFAVRELRLPRAIVGALAGASFGLAGAAFQVLLRNPLASPDIIGISAGASAAAVGGIVFLGLGGVWISVFAVVAALVVAAAIYLLAWRDGVAGGRLILVGIGVAAMLNSFVAYALSQAPSWSLQEALRWLSGTLNGATLVQGLPLAVALLVFGGVLLVQSRALAALQMGDDTAAAIGVAVPRTRLLVVLSAVAVIAVATAVCGPISFVAFLARPIASRLTRAGGPLLVLSALVGALLVVLADFTGQILLPARYPVGIVTGVLGAPYLLYLIVLMHRKGAA